MAGPKPNPSFDHRSGIYRFFHTSEKGKYREYIGSAMDFHVRLRRHTSDVIAGKHKSKLMQRIYDKYGPDALSFEIIEVVDIPPHLSDDEARALLLAHEQIWLDGRQPVMNTCKVAGNTFGFRHSAKSKELIRQRQYEKPPVSDETKAKISQNRSGIPVSEETRAKISSTLTGHVRTDASRAKQSESTTGVPKSPEHRQSMSAAQKRRGDFSNLKNNQIGHEVTEETRQKLREANIGKTASVETREKMRASHTGLKQSDETKAKKRASMLAYHERKSLEGMNGDSHPDGETTEATS